MHLNTDPRIAECLAIVRQKVDNPESVTEDALTHARQITLAMRKDTRTGSSAVASAAAFSAAASTAFSVPVSTVVYSAAAYAASAAFAAIYNSADRDALSAASAYVMEQRAQFMHLLHLAKVCWTFTGFVQTPLMRKIPWGDICVETK